MRWVGSMMVAMTLCQPWLARGQTFSRRHDTFGNSEAQNGHAIELASDSGYFIVQGTYFVDTGYLFHTVALTRYSVSGSFIADSNEPFGISSSYPGWANSSCRTMDGGIAIGGGTYNVGDTQRVALIRFHPDGSFRDMHEYLPSGFEWIGRQAKQTPDGGFVICGVTSSVGLQDAFLLKTDSTGELEWVQTYGLPNKLDFAVAIDLAPGGGYYIGGRQQITASDHDLWVVRTDNLGNTIWDETYGTPYLEMPYAHLVTTSDSLCVFASSFNTGFNDHHRLGIVKVDSAGGVLWWHYYGQAVNINSTLRVVKEAEPFGDLIAAGQSYIPGYINGVLLRTNAQGDSLWMRFYHYEDSLWTEGSGAFWDVLPTPDGGFVAAGTAYNPNGAPYPPGTSQDVWIVKVDSMGCLVPGCDTVTGIESLVTNYRDALVVAPNPAHEQVTLTWRLPERFMKPARLTIVNAAGAWMHDGPIDLSAGSHQVDVSGYPSGMYYMHVVQAGTWVTGAKVVVE